MLFGSGLLTPAIQAIAIALLSGAVPAEWLRRWDRGPEKPQAWLREIVRKRIALLKWKSASAKGNLLSEPLALGDLFNPATFVNALRQQSARLLNTAIDRVQMISSWTKDAKSLGKQCPLPCTLTGLLLQGAAFNGGALQEPAPEASEITSAPQVHFGFVPVDKSKDSDPSSKGPNDDGVEIPVYLNPSREEFLMEFVMPIGKTDKNKWILAGTALYLSEEE